MDFDDDLQEKFNTEQQIKAAKTIKKHKIRLLQKLLIEFNSTHPDDLDRLRSLDAQIKTTREEIKQESIRKKDQIKEYNHMWPSSQKRYH